MKKFLELSSWSRWSLSLSKGAVIGFMLIMAFAFVGCDDSSSAFAGPKDEPGVESSSSAERGESSSSVIPGRDSESSNSEKAKSSSDTRSEAEQSSSSEKTGKSSSSVDDASSRFEFGCKTETEDNCEYGELIDDRDGQTYKTVTIGIQTWMAQNLNYEAANSYCYKDNASNCTKYGRLYTWAASMDSVGTWSTNGKGCGYDKTCSPTYPVRGVCPEGWHLPMQTEWLALFTAVGGVSTVGKMLKSTNGWDDYMGKSGNGTDAYAFSALPAGYSRYYGGDYSREGYEAMFWSSTESDSNYAYSVHLSNSDGDHAMAGNSKIFGFSVRCLKDKDPLTVVKGEMTDTRDGQTYKTVTIGPQTWMAQNLNFAYTGVPYDHTIGVKRYTSDSTSWCYDNNASNCTKYGRLYTWAASMDSVGTWSTNGKGCGFLATCSPTYPVRGVCPEGWHLPTQAEWNALIAAVAEGKSTAGKILKSTSGWNDNDRKSGNGTDAYAFSVLPAGRRYEDGAFYDEGRGASFWSSTQCTGFTAWILYLDFRYDDVGYSFKGAGYMDGGFSVRCVKD